MILHSECIDIHVSIDGPLLPFVCSSFSFPSGHTISATFLVASLLFVLIPMVLRRKPEGLGIDPSPLISMQKVG